MEMCVVVVDVVKWCPLYSVHFLTDCDGYYYYGCECGVAFLVESVGVSTCDGEREKCRWRGSSIRSRDCRAI